MRRESVKTEDGRTQRRVANTRVAGESNNGHVEYKQSCPA
jgi:hypothetical protein